MDRLGGIVKSVRVDQEKKATVLRFVMESGNDRIPVEMRGSEIRGVLGIGDQVVLKGSGKRDRDGLIRPKEIVNKTTNSIVRVKRPSVIARLFGFVFSVGIPIASGVLSAIIIRIIKQRLLKHAPSSTPKRELLRRAPEGAAQAAGADVIPLIIGIVIGLIVFYFLYIRRRRHLS